MNGLGRLIRDFPRIPGVEFSGEVIESQDPCYQPGDKVIATGWRIGEISHGAALNGPVSKQIIWSPCQRE